MVNSGRLILILNIPNGKLDWQHLISFLDILSKVLLMYEENYNINSNLIDATFLDKKDSSISKFWYLEKIWNLT